MSLRGRARRVGLEVTDMAPSTPIEGQMYIDVRDEQVYVWSDGLWMRIANAVEAIEHYERMMEEPKVSMGVNTSLHLDNRWEKVVDEL